MFEGDIVEVFCRYCTWNPQSKYMVIDSIVSGTQFPRIGKTDGWVLAEIIEFADCDPKSFVSPLPASPAVPFVKVKFCDPLWADKFGNILSDKSLFQWLPLDSIRCVNAFPRKQTTILVVRWGGSVPVDEHRFDFAFSDKLIQELMDTIHTELGTELEIQTVWVSNSLELAKIGIPKKNSYAMYFLWGSNHDGKPGYVFSSDLIALMKRMEANGIVTKYPNHAELYSLITSKTYQAILSTNPLLAIPATCMIPVSRFLRNPFLACQNIPFNEGVVKIGGSWMGDGVRAFTSDLQAKAQSLVEQGGVVDSLIVQKKINVLCEPRVFLFNGKIENIRYTWNEKTDSVTGRIHALRTCPQSRAGEELFAGNLENQKKAELRIAELVIEWTRWLETVTGELPVFVRIDFLVDTDINVWTCELGEMGSSMVGFREGKALLFEHVAKSMKHTVPKGPPPQL